MSLMWQIVGGCFLHTHVCTIFSSPLQHHTSKNEVVKLFPFLLPIFSSMLFYPNPKSHFFFLLIFLFSHPLVHFSLIFLFPFSFTFLHIKPHTVSSSCIFSFSFTFLHTKLHTHRSLLLLSLLNIFL